MNQRRPKRRLISMTLIILVVGIMIVSGLYWQQNVSAFYETTNNAYITGRIVPLTALAVGNTIEITVEDGDEVTAGQLIVKLDDTDASNWVTNLEQRLALTVREIRALRQKTQSLSKQLTHIELNKTLAEEEYLRRERLGKQKMVSQEEINAARTKRDSLDVALEVARQKHLESTLLAGGMPLAQHPKIKSAVAELVDAYIALERTNVLAPVSGKVAGKSVQLGQYAQIGTRLLNIVERQSSWVEANFKETQLRNLRAGQEVEITSDIYGEDRPLKGIVSAIGAGTGSVFSLLPPQNATGNWIKIVQRIPVRIDFVDRADIPEQLPLGASLTVTVNTKDREAKPHQLDSKHRATTTVNRTAIETFRQRALVIIDQNNLSNDV